MRRLAPRPLSVAVTSAAARLAPATPLARVQGVWEATAGAAIAREAQPVSLRDGRLVVSCASAVWASELTLMGPSLADRLNGAVGDVLVRELRCDHRTRR